MARVNVLGHHLEGNDEVTSVKNYYSSWRTTNSEATVRFLSLFEGFKEKGYLSTLDAGALRLYLYFGFVANNTYGDSWHSIETIAKYFGKQTRTIDTWIQELVDAGLIYRTRDRRKSSSTFLVPYSNTLIFQYLPKKYESDTQEIVDDAINFCRDLSALYGPLQVIYHVFHWGAKKGKKPSGNENATNFLFLITNRDGVLTGHVFELKNSSDYGISELLIDDVATFRSPFMYDNTPLIGIAVRHSYRLKENHDTLLNLLRDLSAATPDILAQHPGVEYGLIESVLEEHGSDEGTE